MGKVVSLTTGVEAKSEVNIEGRLPQLSCPRADVAQTAERLTCNQQVAGSTPAVGSGRGSARTRRWRSAESTRARARRSTSRGSSSVGRASAFQAERRGFDSRLPLFGVDRELARAERRRRTLGTPRSAARARGHLACALRAPGAQVAQSAEHVLGKDEVGGSIPLLGLLKDGAPPCVERDSPAGEERYPSGQREQTVNLPAYAFGGSNPPPSTTALGGAIGLSGRE